MIRVERRVRKNKETHEKNTTSTKEKEIRLIGFEVGNDKTFRILFDSGNHEETKISFDYEDTEELYNSIKKFRDKIKNPEKYDDTNFDDDEKLLGLLGLV